jgi:hypothetical protein
MFKAPSQNLSKVEITKQYAEEQLESSGSMIA